MIPKVGDNVFSKNGTEFNCTISSVNSNSIILEYYDDYVEECTVSRSSLTVLDDGWEMPNWTAHFDQLYGD